ncbi:MAG: hypothetical protein R2720_08910 [Candidatus Nanopelagicales bacterium]
MTEDQQPDAVGPDDAPWWHSAPAQPEVDSMLVEGLRLANALRDWAVESGAVAAVSDLTQTAANSAAAYLAQMAEPGSPEQPSEAEPVDVDQPVGEGQPVVRCTDCPVCQGLDALERSNPQLAQTARAGLAQVNAVIAGLLGSAGGQANS